MFDRKRREFITLVGGAAMWPLAARAQQGERMRRIGVLMSMPADDPEGQARLTGFLQGLQELGWTAGRNARIDYRWAADDAGRPKYAAELVALTPDVILASTSQSVAALQQASRAVPIVFAAVTDPVGQGFVGSLARLGSVLTQAHRDLIIKLADQHRLPSIYTTRYFVADGGLMSYGPDRVDLYRRAAGYVDRILKGEKPANLPVQAPTKYELVINLKTAKALGLEVPPTLLARADEVIE